MNSCLSNLILILQKILWLASSTYTSARTCHYLYKVVMLFPFFYLLNYFACISSSMYYSNIYIQITNF